MHSVINFSQEETVTCILSLEPSGDGLEAGTSITSCSLPESSTDEVLEDHDFSLDDIRASERVIASWNYNDTAVLSDRQTGVVLFITLLTNMPKPARHNVTTAKSVDKRLTTDGHRSSRKDAVKNTVSEFTSGMLPLHLKLDFGCTAIKGGYLGCVSRRQSRNCFGTTNHSEAWTTLRELRSSAYDGIHSTKSENLTGKSHTPQSVDMNELRDVASEVSASCLMQMTTFERENAPTSNKKGISANCSIFTSPDKTEVKKFVVWKLPDHSHRPSTKHASNKASRRKPSPSCGVPDPNLNSRQITSTPDYRNGTCRSNLSAENEVQVPVYEPKNKHFRTSNNKDASERTKKRRNVDKCDVVDADFQSKHVRDGEFTPNNKDITVLYFNRGTANVNDFVQKVSRSSLAENEDTDISTRSHLVHSENTLSNLLNNKDISNSSVKCKSFHISDVTVIQTQPSRQINDGVSTPSQRGAQERSTKETDNKSNTVEENLRLTSMKDSAQVLAIQDSTCIVTNKDESSRASKCSLLQNSSVEKPCKVYQLANDGATPSKITEASGGYAKQRSADYSNVIETDNRSTRISDVAPPTSSNKGGSERHCNSQPMGQSVVEESMSVYEFNNYDVTTCKNNQLVETSSIEEADSSPKQTDYRSIVFNNGVALHRSPNIRVKTQNTTHTDICNNGASTSTNEDVIGNYSTNKQLVTFYDTREAVTKSKLARCGIYTQDNEKNIEEHTKPESLTINNVRKTNQNTTEESIVSDNMMRPSSLGIDCVTNSILGLNDYGSSIKIERTLFKRTEPLDKMNIMVAANVISANVLSMLVRPVCEDRITREPNAFTEEDNEAVAWFPSGSPGAQQHVAFTLPQVGTSPTPELPAHDIPTTTGLGNKFRYIEREAWKMQDDLGKLLDRYQEAMAEPGQEKRTVRQLSLDLSDVTLLDQMVATLQGQLERLSLRKWGLTQEEESLVTVS